MDNYLLLGHRILRDGRRRGDRTGTGTRSIRSATLIWDLREGFPLMTTKSVNLQSVFHELAWILKGETNIQYLVDNNCGFIWRPWSVTEDVIEETPLTNPDRLFWLRVNNPVAHAKWLELKLFARPVAEGEAYLDQLDVPRTRTVVKVKAGETNAPYGPNWRRWKGRNGEVIDQIEYMLNLLRTNPESRRILLSAWDPANLPDESVSPQENIKQGNPCLTPCHHLVEFYTDKLTTDERVLWLTTNNPFIWDKWVKAVKLNEDAQLDQFLDEHGVPERFLDLKFTMRSSDVCLGLPYNIASYGMLLLMFAKTLNMIPRELEYNGTNVHMYENHIEKFAQQFSRSPRPLPTLTLTTKHDRVEDYEWGDFELHGYEPHEFIKYEVSV